MIERFKTQEEAEKRRDYLNQGTSGGHYEGDVFHAYFCPIIHDLCRTDCVCWVKADITAKSGYVTKDEPYAVIGNYCGNAMFTEHEIAQS